MKNTVSHPTAQRLKAAGFPQPEPQEGQFWYRPSGGTSYIDYVENNGDVYALWNGEVNRLINFESAIFTPTATDILREIEYVLNPLLLLKSGEWVVCYLAPAGNIVAITPKTHDNPAEAAAAAWLEIHEKNAFTPNARIRFRSDHGVECYDAEGNQNILAIEKGKEYAALLKDGKVKIQSVFGLVEFNLRVNDIVFIGWLPN